MFREFSYRDRIEPEIRDDGKYREIVVYLRIESVSLYIEIVRDDLDHRNRDECGDDLCSDLSECVGVDLSSRHARKIKDKNTISKGENYRNPILIRSSQCILGSGSACFMRKSYSIWTIR